MQSIDTKNIILTGFMATGKTAVGRLLAKKLKREFIDTDQLIENRQKLTISEIFKDLGESAFRKMESEIAQELSEKKELVISTGGRLLLDLGNVAALSRTGRVFCLVATPQEILSRLENDNDRNRPLLNVPNPREQILVLLQERKRGYKKFIKFTTDEKSPAVVADNVLKFMQRSSTHFVIDNPVQPYTFAVGSGILPFTRELAGTGSMLVVITDTVVGKLYAQSLGYVDHVITIQSGNQQKTLATVQTIYNQLLEIGFDRSGTILALGGSVVIDISGFVAATYMRGVNLVHCPTSLLAMADTSVGGKNSIDLPQGKKLIGTFKQPSLVIADVTTLTTLPPEEFLSAMAEVVKHSLLTDTDFFKKIENGSWTLKTDSLHSSSSEIQALVAHSIQVKIDYVQEDPFDEGIKTHLNLGHTFAHAIERVSNDEVRHGEAVAMGLAAAADLSVRLGYCDLHLKDRINLVLSKIGLPTRIPAKLSPEAIFNAMRQGRKISTQSLSLVLPVKVGQVCVIDAPTVDVLSTLQAMSDPNATVV